MKRRSISVLLVVLLLVAIVMMVWRRVEGPSVPDGFVVIEHPSRLESVAFRIDEPAPILVEASGSVGADGGLEAYAWILDATTRRVAWRMSAARARKAEGTHVVQRDTLRLPPGTYEVFFTPHGRSVGDGNPARRMLDRRFKWRNDAPQWYVVLRSLGGAPPVRIRDSAELPDAEGLVWHSSRDAHGQNEEVMLDVTTEAVVHATFIAAEIGSGSIARLERISDSTVLWEAQSSQTRPAGGAPRNRRVEADVRLVPGLYRATTRLGGNQGPYYWEANPPDDPRAWGLTLLVRSGSVRTLELWSGRAPLVRLRGDRPEAEWSARVRVTQEATMAVYGMGEFASGAADFGWLENDATGERIWEMNRNNTAHAGGSNKNREGQTVLTLAPGSYTLRYRTDDSHHFGDFNDDPPTHEERYGTALFLLGPEGAAQDTDETTTSSEPGEPPAPPAPPPPPVAGVAEGAAGVSAPPAVQGALAAIARVGNKAQRQAAFEVRGRPSLRVYATGEFDGGNAYDAAWITNAKGETVWEMSQAALLPAGGGDRNRYCDVKMTLPEGRYTLHFKSDGSHAFGNFGDAPPRYPEAWGVIVTEQ